MSTTPRHPGPAIGDARHPGALLRDHVLPALSLSVSQAARDLGIARQTLHRIIAGDATITPEMAIRLERLCGVPPEFWLDRQQRHQLQRVKHEIGSLLTEIPPRLLPDEVIEQIGAGDER